MSGRYLIVIPALNEARVIRAVVESALAQHPHVLVIDDGSTDGTSELIADLPVQRIRHEQPHGKGRCLQEAFALALAQGYERVLSMDGDGQHRAEDIPRMLSAAQRHPGHIVIAARLIGREQQPASRRRANDAADFGVSWACGRRVVDSQSGQRLYPRAVLELAAQARPSGFVFESEILILAAARLRMHTVSVPIESRYPPDRRASHFRGVRDTTRITRMILWRLLSRGMMPWNLYRAWREPALLEGAQDMSVDAAAGKRA